jgi:hypothetical protein
MNLMKNQIIQKFKSFEILKEKVGRKKAHFFNHWTKTLCSMSSKISALDAGHMQENNIVKKHVWLSIETHFGILWDLCVFIYKPKYSYAIMYECKNSPSSHELF